LRIIRVTERYIWPGGQVVSVRLVRISPLVFAWRWSLSRVSRAIRERSALPIVSPHDAPP
jgi:hypothetical protein